MGIFGEIAFEGLGGGRFDRLWGRKIGFSDREADDIMAELCHALDLFQDVHGDERTELFSTSGEFHLLDPASYPAALLVATFVFPRRSFRRRIL